MVVLGNWLGNSPDRAKPKKDTALTKVTNLNERALLRQPGRHRVADNLFLKVLDPDRAYWVVRYSVGGVSRETSLGSARKLTRAEATRRYHAIMVDVDQKIDPLTKKRAAKTVQTLTAAPTFGELADKHIEVHAGSWKNPKHKAQWKQTLTQYCDPIRKKPVDQITTQDMLAVLTPLWNSFPETARRLRGRIEVILDGARALGYIHEDRSNPARWRGHLDKLLPKPKRLVRGNHAALPYADIAAFVERLRAMKLRSALALEFLILTATRTSEVLHMTWREVDFPSATWVVPADRMKTGEAFSVPLSDRAVAVLAEARQRARKPPTADSFVFSGTIPKQPLSPMSLSQLLRRMEVAVTVHGFRTTWRTWASEVAHAEFEDAEAALSHRVGSAVSRAYNRTNLLERRRPLMAAWSDFVTGKTSGSVVAMRKKARP